MKLVESIMTRNPCYRSGRKIAVRGLMLHSIGCPQPSAPSIIKYWNSPSYNTACVHGFIDANDGTVYQTLPWNHRGWHGGGSSNNTHIGVEMCEPSCIRYTGGATFTCSDPAKARACAERTYRSAVELFAYLCKKFDLDPMKPGVIVSHKEGHALGIATNHGDPEHLWSQLKMEYTMDGFRSDVSRALGGSGSVHDIPKSFQVRVPVSHLNIRVGPGTDTSTTGRFTGVGTFTIVDVEPGRGSKTGWGLLKSFEEGRNGWIALDYVTVL